MPEGTIVYAIGDIHARLDLLEVMHAAILDDADCRRAPRRVVVYLGDYISRAAHSRELIDLLLSNPLPGFERVTLKGNHEDLLLRFLDGETAAGAEWLDYGGIQALAAYGIDASAFEVEGESCLPVICDQMKRAMPAAHLDFLRSLRLCHREGDYYFVHAGARPGVPLNRQTAADQVWIRGQFLRSREDFGATIVHGHCISEQPDVRPNRIGIDTGAYETGRLTCVVLEGAERAFLQTAGKPRESRREPVRGGAY